MKQIPTKIIFLLIFAHFTINLSAQNWQWADAITGITNMNIFKYRFFGSEMAVDSQGNIYVIGLMGGGTTQFGNFTFNTLNEDEDIFFVKYSVCGEVVWAKKIGSNFFDDGGFIHIDQFDNIYIAGINNSSHFLARYTTEGIMIWTKIAPELILGIDSDSEGNLYLIGEGYGYPQFGIQSDTINSYWEYLAKYNANYELQWVKIFINNEIGSGFYFNSRLAIDKNDNICIATSYRGTIHLGEDTSITAVNEQSSLLAMYQKDGSLSWAKQLESGMSSTLLQNIGIDDNGNIYANGLYIRILDLYNGTNIKVDSILFTKTNISGEEIWRKKYNFAGTGYGGHKQGNGIKIQGGHLFIPGYYTSENISPIRRGLYLTCMDLEGNIQWIKSGGIEETVIHDMVMFGNDAIYFTGFLALQAKFDEIIINATNYEHFYVARLKLNSFVVDAGEDITFCAGEQAQIGNPPINGYTYQWTPTEGLSNPNISNPTISLTHTENNTITYQYILKITDNSCPNRPFSKRDTIKVNVLPAYNNLKIFTGSTTVCPFVGGVKYWLNKNENYNFVWEVSGGTIESGQGSDTIRVFWANPNSNAWVKITASHKTSLCPKTITLPIIVDEILKPDTPSGENQLCLDETKIFTYQTSLLNNGSSYQWYTDDATAIIEGTSTQSELHIRWLNAGLKKIWVVEINQTPCEGSSDTLIVEVLPEPVSPQIQGLKKVPVFASQVPYSVENKIGSVYQWNLSSGGEIMSGQGTSQIFINWLEEGEFVLTVQETDANGCMGKPYTLNIEVIPFIPPNVITPNNDQLNDYWVLDEIEFFPENEIKIFNRWGKLVFESKNYKNNWQADVLDDGVYFYQIYLHPKLKIIKGWIKVMR